MSFAGVFAAAVTPRGKQGEIDFGASFLLIDYLCKAGVGGIALCSSTGEFGALDDEERSRLVYLAVKRSRVPILAGVGNATLDGSVALAREARDAGAAGLLLPPPHFFRFDQDDLREFYRQFLAHLDGGIPIYLDPSGLHSPLEPETISELLSSGHFAGIAHTGDAPEPGAAVTISAAACAVPELVVALNRAMCAGNAAQAAGLAARLREFQDWVRQFPEPALVKTATELRGLKVGPLAVPLSPAKQQKLAQFRAWFESWLPETKKLAAHG